MSLLLLDGVRGGVDVDEVSAATVATSVLGMAVVRRNRKRPRALAAVAVIGGSCGCPSTIGRQANAAPHVLALISRRFRRYDARFCRLP